MITGMPTDARQHQPGQAGLAHDREHEDGDDHDHQQEPGAAARVHGRDSSAARFGVGPPAGLVGVYHLVLGSVILKHAAQVGDERDAHDVDEKDHDADKAFHQVEHEGVVKTSLRSASPPPGGRLRRARPQGPRPRSASLPAPSNRRLGAFCPGFVGPAPSVGPPSAVGSCRRLLPAPRWRICPGPSRPDSATRRARPRHG